MSYDLRMRLELLGAAVDPAQRGDVADPDDRRPVKFWVSEDREAAYLSLGDDLMVDIPVSLEGDLATIYVSGVLGWFRDDQEEAPSVEIIDKERELVVRIAHDSLMQRMTRVKVERDAGSLTSFVR